MEVGATRYCCKLVLCCFRSLGLRNRTEIELSLKPPKVPFVYQNPPSTTSKINSLNINSPLPSGFINKGTRVTQMSSCRHCVSYHHSEIEYQHSHYLYLHFQNQLLWTWKENPNLKKQIPDRIISESPYAPFSFNTHQDAAEMLQFVIDELKRTPVAANELISNIIRINVFRNQCFCFSAKEEKLDILKIPLPPNTISSLTNSSFLKSEILESQNKWFCLSYNCLTESTRETTIISSDSILVIQSSRFST